MSSYENHAGITITSSKMQLVEVVHNNDQFLLNNIDEVFFNESINFDLDKETKILSLLQAAYNELIIKKSLKSSLVSFSLPLSLFNIMQIPYDNTLLNQDLMEEFRWEFSVLFPYLKVKDLVIQYIEVEKNPLNDNNTAIVISLNRRFLYLLHTFCEQNKLKLRFVDNVHIASDRALFLNNNLNDKGVALSIYFSNNLLSTIISFNGRPVYFKLNQLKDAGEITTVLKEEIENNKIINVNTKMITSAFVTGDELSPSMTEAISRTIGVNLSYFNPFLKIIPDLDLQDNIYFTEKFNSFAPAAGIAFRLS